MRSRLDTEEKNDSGMSSERRSDKRSGRKKTAGTFGNSMRHSSKKSPKSASYRYVYCIIPSESAGNLPEITGIDDTEIKALSRKKVCAVVSETKDKKHEILDNGVMHQSVVEEVLKYSPLIPMGFGQISSEVSILSFLEKNSYRLGLLMQQYSGKRELVLKASWKMDQVLKDLCDSDDQIRIMHNHLNRKDDLKNHRMKIKIGQKVSDSIDRRSDSTGNEFLKKLKPFSDRVKINKNLNNDMFLNAAFLVDKVYEENFDLAVNDLEDKYSETVSLNYTVSAPYDFINLRL
ncbi:GvpL/GvpF family gas vesicle protein [Methanoplanus endosymbiosus]|uniref:GvpL/GvpF family gas vesicle protein n=1 Tax=Methanoplanus endosymbiosus TaxID=33865 RepID=A0A9E7PPF0_9EURY|nr:GvpL/GvpF family gas vesicle protein [Methanoplanus endosymbiosus]UUX93047.1 GvpL/GvpF family gas vesicle protein [Methanoplanus endosymbiosus]